MTDPLLVATIAKIQDDLTYVIEEMLRGHGGEARQAHERRQHGLRRPAGGAGGSRAGWRACADDDLEAGADDHGQVRHPHPQEPASRALPL